MAIEVMQIPDELLMRAAEERGSRSTEAQILAELRSKRAQDRQTFAYRCGSTGLSARRLTRGPSKP